MLSNAKHINQIKLLGGEPTIMPETMRHDHFDLKDDKITKQTETLRCDLTPHMTP